MKIRDRERVEPPHVTILWKTKAWRLGLRSDTFLDERPDPAEVPDALLDAIRGSWDELIAKWDEMYPENPVSSEGGE